MEPKWFRPHDVAEGHEVYVVDGDAVVKGTVTNIDNDGHYVVRSGEGGAVTCVRSVICHATVSASAPAAQAVRDTAELRHGDDRHTVKLFSRSAEGRRTRQRAVRGELTSEKISETPDVSRPLHRHLQSPLSAETGATVLPSDYVTMTQTDGTPNSVTFDDLRRKLGEIAKQKAPGYSGNGPDLHAPMPDVWAVDVLLDMALPSGRTEWVGLVMVPVAVLRATRHVLSCVWTTFRSSARSTTDGADTYVTGSNVLTAMWRHWLGPSRRSENAEG